MTASSKEPMFLYPELRQFPFDETCEQIVRALESRNWDVPGIIVRFNTFGPMNARSKYCMVKEIKSDDFSFNLYFCRFQKNVGEFTDTAAISRINIPKMELDIDNARSVPTFTKYIGETWENDKKIFVKSLKGELGRIDHEPGMYLRYIVDDNAAGAKPDILIRGDNDPSNKYPPEDEEPIEYRISTVFQIFQLWLMDYLLAKILEYPTTNEEIDIH